MLKHEDQARIQDFLDGRLDPEGEAQVEAALARDAGARGYRDRLERLRRLVLEHVARVPSFLPSPDFVERVMAAIRRERMPRDAATTSPASYVAMLSAVAAAVFFTAFFFVPHLERERERLGRAQKPALARVDAEELRRESLATHERGMESSKAEARKGVGRFSKSGSDASSTRSSARRSRRDVR